MMHIIPRIINNVVVIYTAILNGFFRLIVNILIINNNGTKVA
jgi:hypothetical protein